MVFILNGRGYLRAASLNTVNKKPVSFGQVYEIYQHMSYLLDE